MALQTLKAAMHRDTSTNAQSDPCLPELSCTKSPTPCSSLVSAAATPVLAGVSFRPLCSDNHSPRSIFAGRAKGCLDNRVGDMKGLRNCRSRTKWKCCNCYFADIRDSEDGCPDCGHFRCHYCDVYRIK